MPIYLLIETKDLLFNYIEENAMKLDGYIIEEHEKHKLWQYNNYIYISELHIKIHDCVYYCIVTKDEETDKIEYEDDFLGLTFRNEISNKIVGTNGYNNFDAAILNYFDANFKTLNNI